MVGQAFEAESGEMDEAGLRETLSREGMVYASWLIALSGSFVGIGLSTSRRLVPKVTPAKRNPAVELPIRGMNRPRPRWSRRRRLSPHGGILDFA